MSKYTTTEFPLVLENDCDDEEIHTLESALQALERSQVSSVGLVPKADPIGYLQYPRLFVMWHRGHGYSILAHEDDRSIGFFLVTGPDLGEPEVEVDLAGNLEKWPRELFVTFKTALAAMESFQATGTLEQSLTWVGVSAFNRRILVKGPDGRLSWGAPNDESSRLSLRTEDSLELQEGKTYSTDEVMAYIRVRRGRQCTAENVLASLLLLPPEERQRFMLLLKETETTDT